MVIVLGAKEVPLGNVPFRAVVPGASEGQGAANIGRRTDGLPQSLFTC